MRRLTKWLIWLVLGLALVFVIAALVLPGVFSARMAVVRSSSMEPAMPAGSLAMTSPVDTTAIEVGDIIAFTPPWDTDVTVSHRVVEVRSDGFVTKGDAVEDVDPYLIRSDYVTGKVSWHLPHIGYALNSIRGFVSTTWGLAVLVVMPALVIFGSALSDAYFMYSPRKRRARLTQRRLKRRRSGSRGTWRLRRAT